MNRFCAIFLCLLAFTQTLSTNGREPASTDVAVFNGIKAGISEVLARVYDPQTGRFLSADPVIQDPNNLQCYNRYSYCTNNPLVYIDPTGYTTYRMNRELGGSHARPISQIYSHTFAFTARDGTVTATYSWGNSANTHGWNINQPEDIQAASEALQYETTGYWDENGNIHFDGYLEEVGGDELDPYVDEAFQEINLQENEHKNYILFSNSKTETTKLTDLASNNMENDSANNDNSGQTEDSSTDATTTLEDNKIKTNN